jgi:hypothetical protein
MEKHIVYDPVAQDDASESPCGDSENEPLVKQYTRRVLLVSYTKRCVVIAAFLFFYTILVVSLTLRVAHGNRRVGRRFLNTPVDNNYIVYDARVMGQWEDEGKSRSIEYFAEPSAEIDRNWHEIVERMHFRCSSFLIENANLHTV